MRSKRNAVALFGRRELKNPMSKFVLQYILREPSLLRRISFVRDREYYTNTLLISEVGSPRLGFELELGAQQREEVSMVNGRLVRLVRKEHAVCIREPVEALEALRSFRGRLYVVFAFAGSSPTWYDAVVEPAPALPPAHSSNDGLHALLREILRDQIDLALLAISLRQEVDAALERRDAAEFHRLAPLYRTVMARTLWELPALDPRKD